MKRPLSAAQRYALQTAADGQPLKHVARDLGITLVAAKNRRRDAMRKLGVSTVPAAVAVAMQLGIVRVKKATEIDDEWRMVPKTPTPEMVAAMARAWQLAVEHDDPNECIAEWAAALAAAPEPPNAVVLGLPVVAYDAGGEVLIEAAKQMNGRTLWKVREHGNVLAKTGEWEWEPMPSGRDDEFLARCRFDTPQDALACLRGAKW